MGVIVVYFSVAVPVLVAIIAPQSAAASVIGISVNILPRLKLPVALQTSLHPLQSVIFILFPILPRTSRRRSFHMKTFDARHGKQPFYIVSEIFNAVSVGEFQIKAIVAIAVQIFLWQTRSHHGRNAAGPSG